MRVRSLIAVSALLLSGAPAPNSTEITVHEGTSMSVAASPDGKTLAIDLQGSIWTLPATGGSLLHCISLLASRGASDITVVCALAAPLGKSTYWFVPFKTNESPSRGSWKMEAPFWSKP